MASGSSTDVAARAALVAGAAALAHGDDLALGLRTLLDAIARPLGIASARDRRPGRIGHGLRDRRVVRARCRRRGRSRRGHATTGPPGHDDVRGDRADLRRRAHEPGRAEARSHLPLIVTRGRTPRVLGVLALAHEDEIAPEAKPIIGAAADLAAARIERQLSGH